MTAAIITRSPAKWDGPKPAPADFDGYLYTCTVGAQRFSSYGLAWVERLAKSRAPDDADIVREWEP